MTTKHTLINDSEILNKKQLTDCKISLLKCFLRCSSLLFNPYLDISFPQRPLSPVFE